MSDGTANLCRELDALFNTVEESTRRGNQAHPRKMNRDSLENEVIMCLSALIETTPKCALRKAAERTLARAKRAWRR